MEHQRNQFDEQAALQALEHLRDQIQSARSRREQKIAEFEAFVRSNRAASQAERLAALNERETAALPVQAAARTADRAAESRPPHVIPEPKPWPEPSSDERFEPFQPFQPEPRHGTIAVARSFWSDRRFQIAAGVVAVLLLMLVLAPWGDDAQESQAVVSPPGTTSETAPATPGSDRVPPAPAAQSSGPAGPGAEGQTPAAIVRPLLVEVTTLRPVWMRVVVDGQRRVERQVPGGQELTFGADRAIALRVGDAGAVRLAVDGVDQGVLGRDGQVVNRAFTPRPR